MFTMVTTQIHCPMKTHFLIAGLLLMFALSCSNFELEHYSSISAPVGLMTKSIDVQMNYSQMQSYWLQRDSIINVMKLSEDGDEKLSLCQMDENDLLEMSTSELVATCYTFPLAYDVFLSNDEKYGTEFYIDHFNGLKELCKRSDGLQELIRLYSSVDPGQGHPQLSEAYIERLLLADSFYSKLSFEDATLLSDVIAEKIKRRKEATYPLISQCRILELSIRLNNNGFPSANKINQVSMPNRSYYTSVYTPFGQSVDAYVESDEWSPQEINDIAAYITSTYSNVTIAGPASKKYNCHAYAWMGATNYWIFGYDVYKYYTNDLYTSCSSSEAEKIVYAGDHSAVKNNSSYYISKWGDQSLVIHAPTNVPASYSPSNRSYYRDPVTISGPDYMEVGETYVYTVSPYMSYATYDWSIDQNDNRYQIISINNNVLQVKFLMNAIFDVYCDVCNSSGNHVKTVMYETLY